MKKVALLLALALVWGCQKIPSPTTTTRADESQYGSSVVTIPGLKALGKSTAGAGYKFVLTITGTGMDPMTFSYALGTRDTAFAIEKIPAGSSRLFTGTLYSPQGATHEGSAYTDILPGKTAYVKLYLRMSGSAQVDVIIEGVNDDTIGGCFKLMGRIDTVSFDSMSLKIVENSASSLLGYFYRDEAMIGKFYGSVSGTNLKADIVIPGSIEQATFYGQFSSDYSAFKGDIYSIQDTGYLYGQGISCEPAPTPDTGALGCLSLGGYLINNLDTILLDGYTVNIFGHTGPQFWSYIYQGGKIAGKFWGTVDSYLNFSGELSLMNSMPALVKGTLGNQNFDAFKSTLYARSDTTKYIGNMYGSRTSCSDTAVTPPPPPPSSCVIDTMGGTSSCKTVATWLTYATSACKEQGLTLGSYTFMTPCGTKKETTYRYICYECCK